MKNLIIALAIVCGTFTTAFAQKKYKRIFYKPQTIENNDLKVSINDAVSTPAGIKFKLKLINKTNDYIIYKPNESVFKINGKDYNPNEEWMIIRPNEQDWKVIDIKGADLMIDQNFKFVLDGVYKANINEGAITAPNFTLPPSQNDFKAGGFSVTHVSNKKTTARTDAKFNITYNGDKIGIFEPNKVAMKMPDGKEYANYHSDKEPIVFEKGKEKTTAVAWKDIPTVSGDMQKVDMVILWREAFKEITPKKAPNQTLEIIFDQEQTELKNK
jgi:hypothetical protein